MTCMHYKDTDIQMQEATTRHIVITVKDQDGNVQDLSGFKAFLVIVGENEILKECTISGNEISTTILPEYTLGRNYLNYEIRIYSANEIYEVVSGKINVDRSLHQYLNVPET